MQISRYAVLISASLAFAPMVAHAADTSATFQVGKQTQVPGGILKPGQYTVQVVDSLADRSILRVQSSDGKTNLLMLGVHASAMPHGSGVVVEWQNHSAGKQAIRGFALNGNEQLELVYPKGEAVAIATANETGVVAVDPASEGRAEFSKLQSPDLQMVNLWLLTPTRIGPGTATQSAIEAKHFQPEAAPVQTASSAAPEAPAEPVTGRVHKAAPPANPVAATRVPASPMTTRRATTLGKTLPKTAGDLPLIWLTGFVCMVGIAGFRVRDWNNSRRVVAVRTRS